jgi:hypothetical protein
MEILKLTTEIDQSGYLSLHIPTHLASGLVDNVVVLNPVSSDIKPKPQYDFSDLVGRLTWQGDAVAMQRALRDER